MSHTVRTCVGPVFCGAMGCGAPEGRAPGTSESGARPASMTPATPTGGSRRVGGAVLWPGPVTPADAGSTPQPADGGATPTSNPVVDEMFARAAAAVGFSYEWGGGCWDPTTTTYGSCMGNCPTCTHTGQWGADCSGFIAKVWQGAGPLPPPPPSPPHFTPQFPHTHTPPHGTPPPPP